MEMLILFALWAGGVFMLMRSGAGAQVTGPGQGQGRVAHLDGKAPAFRWTPPERDTDPVCAKTVRTEHAKPSVHDGKVYYFCSRDCREVFEAAPDLYSGAGDCGDAKMEHSHA